MYPYPLPLAPVAGLYAAVAVKSALGDARARISPSDATASRLMVGMDPPMEFSQAVSHTVSRTPVVESRTMELAFWLPYWVKMPAQ